MMGWVVGVVTRRIDGILKFIHSVQLKQNVAIFLLVSARLGSAPLDDGGVADFGSSLFMVFQFFISTPISLHFVSLTPVTD